jgi:hypothetical protein
MAVRDETIVSVKGGIGAVGIVVMPLFVLGWLRLRL